MRKDCGDAAETVWKDYGSSAETLWTQCGTWAVPLRTRRRNALLGHHNQGIAQWLPDPVPLRGWGLGTRLPAVICLEFAKWVKVPIKISSS